MDRTHLSRVSCSLPSEVISEGQRDQPQRTITGYQWRTGRRLRTIPTRLFGIGLSLLAIAIGGCGDRNTTPKPAVPAEKPSTTATQPVAHHDVALSPSPVANKFVVACQGTDCAARDSTTFAGAGVGVWRYDNATDRTAQFSFQIHGVKEGQSAVLIFSNGEASATGAPVIPKEFLEAASPQTNAAPLKHNAMLLVAKLRDKAHALMLRQNFERAGRLIAHRHTIAPQDMALAPVVANVPIAPPGKGTKKTWFDNFVKPAAKYTAIVGDSCALPSGRSAVFWVDAKVTFPDAALAAFMVAFCGSEGHAGGYARVKEQLGDVWGTATSANGDQLISDAGGLQNINIVFLGVPATVKWGGYFSATNNFLKSPDFSSSNEALAFFMNAPGALKDQPYYLSTLLHELTHMVNFYQRTVAKGVRHDVWLEETSAMMTEDIIVPAVLTDGYSIIPLQNVDPYEASGGAVSLINWPELSGPHYAMGGSFGAFLDRRYGINLYQKLVGCDANGSPPSYACLDTLIRSAGGVGYADEFARFGSTIFAALPPTGIPKGVGYPAVKSGAYALAPIDVSKFVSDRPMPAALNQHFYATAHTYNAISIPSGSDTLSGTDVGVPSHSSMMLVVQ